MEKKCILWYNSPAEVWTDALPLGNGKLGVMIFGRPLKEKIQIDDSTFWSGEVSIEKNNRTDTKEVLVKLRGLLAENKYEEADKAGHEFVGIKNNYGTNMPTGNLLLSFDKIGSDDVRQMELSKLENYKRTLDLENSIAQTMFEMNGTKILREAFASNIEQVFALNISLDNGENKQKMFDLRIRYDGMSSDEDASQLMSDDIGAPQFIANDTNVSQSMNNDTGLSQLTETDVTITGADFVRNDSYLIEGNAFETLHSDGTKGVHLNGIICLVTDGKHRFDKGIIYLQEASFLQLYVTLETNMFEKNPMEKCRNLIDKASAMGYEEVRKRHIHDFSELFNRVDFWLEGQEDYKNLPTDVRLENAAKGVNDLGLISLLFHYGRYLFIASSRENSPLPTHMGGIWNDNLYNKQDSTQDMHIDLNIQMQYWIASAIRMNEGCLPLFRWIKDVLVPAGRIAAREEYGAGGWVGHIVSNPWGYASLGWSYNWGAFALGGVWAALEMWSYYAYTRDINFLRETAYPVLKEAAEFCLDYLFKIDGCEYYMAGPSYSPENMFLYEGKGYFLSLATTCDILLIRELFQDVLKCADELADESMADEFIIDEVLERIKEALPKLPPYQIGHWGNLREWYMDFEEYLPGHRHTSHLLGIYPYWQIEADRDIKLAEAVKVSLLGRLKKWEFTSWGIALFMGTYARLFDGDAAYERLKVNLKTQMRKNLFPIMGDVSDMWKGAWELDGNTGITAAMCELIVQSHDNIIHLLPALPSEWRNGGIRDIALYGGNLLSMKWKEGIITEAAIKANMDGEYKIKYNEIVLSLVMKKGESYNVESLYAG